MTATIMPPLGPILHATAVAFEARPAMAISPFAEFIPLLSSIARGIRRNRVFARRGGIYLIEFRINEHLGAIRDQGQMN
jgi:hypothetical protein